MIFSIRLSSTIKGPYRRGGLIERGLDKISNT